MKTNTKGFTLIELLAVIVILAVIALIATPIIMGVIEDAKEQAEKDSAYGYLKAVEQTIAVNLTKEPSASVLEEQKTVGSVGYNGGTWTINYKGTQPTSVDLHYTKPQGIVAGTVTFSSGRSWKVENDGKITKVSSENGTNNG